MHTVFLEVTLSHLPSCLKIYNHYATHTTATFHTSPQPLSFLQSTLSKCHAANLPFIVALRNSSSSSSSAQIHQHASSDDALAVIENDDDDDEVLGYSYLLPFRPDRPAYTPTVETSLFLAPRATGSGLGTRLLNRTIQTLTQRNNSLHLPNQTPFPRLPLPKPEEGESVEYMEGEIRHIVAFVAMEQREDVGEGRRAARFWGREGFVRVGVMGGVGWKFGRWVDVGVFQREVVREVVRGVGDGVGDGEGKGEEGGR
ncbi:hypothetical protein Q9189_006879 [Teloschistes chrysophthalmus]